MSLVGAGNGGGGDPFLQTIQLLGNPAEMERRFAALKQAQEAAEAAIALAGPAAEIPSLHASAVKAREDADAALAEARKRAEEIEIAARANAEAVTAEAAALLTANQAEAAKLKKEADALLAAAQGVKAEADVKRNEVVAAMREVENAKTQAVHEAEMARATRVAFENRLRALNDLLDQFRAAAGSV